MATSTEEDTAKPRSGNADERVRSARARLGEEANYNVLGLPSWVWLVSALALLVIGWGFILSTNNFHFTAPVVFVCLGYGAGVAAVYTMFRTGASAVSGGDTDEDEGSWGRPIGELTDLEREKRALVKAIKEAEFDLEMGKLSQADAEEMIARYRAQAIEVIKEIDRTDGEATVREQIEREVRARLEVAKASKAADVEKRAQGTPRPQGKQGKKPQVAATKQAASAKQAEPADASAKVDEAAGSVEAANAADATADATADTAADAEAAPAADAPAMGTPAAAADAAADVDSHSAGSRGANAGAAKEATP